MLNLLISGAAIGCIITLVILILLPFAVIGITALQRRTVGKRNYEIDGSEFTVKCDNITFYLCITVAVLYFAVAVCYLVSCLCGLLQEDVRFGIFQICCYCIAAVLFGISSVKRKRWKISVSGGGIIFYPGLGKRKEYAWEDLDCVKVKKYRKSTVYKVCVKQEKKRAFAFSSDMIGGQLFAEILRDSGLLS